MLSNFYCFVLVPIDVSSVFFLVCFLFFFLIYALNYFYRRNEVHDLILYYYLYFIYVFIYLFRSTHKS